MSSRYVIHDAGADPFSEKPYSFAAAVLFEVAGWRAAICGEKGVGGGQGSNEGFVFVGGGSAQTVVDVDDYQRALMHLAESVKEEDAVGSAGDRDAELSAGEAEPSEGSCNRRQHVSR